jgi:hypothetical protein
MVAHSAMGAQRRKIRALLICTTAWLGAERATWAEEAPTAGEHARVSTAVPRLHHAPVSTATAHQPLRVAADIDHPELVRHAWLVYTTERTSEPHAVAFKRAGPAGYVATVPASDVTTPWLGYTIELEKLDGSSVAVFAARERMQLVIVPEPRMDARERALSARLNDRRSVFSSSADYVDFGMSDIDTPQGPVLVPGSVDSDPASTTVADRVHDRYFRIEGGYSYRPLGIVTEFSLRVGLVRGQSPVRSGDPLAPGQSEQDRYDVGLNYGAPSVRFFLADAWHLDVGFLTSVTERGYSLGASGALLIGDPYGSKLAIGGETIARFGTRCWTRLDIDVARGLSFAPIVEVSNMPNADAFGVRLIGEFTLELGEGFALAGRGGYQARKFTAGGPSAGATLSYAF